MAERRIPTTLVEWLDDLTVRFLLNLPASELSSVPRLCFQVEEAQWFYEDFVRPAVAASGAPPLPSLPLRQFCLLLFQHCPLLSGFTDAQHLAAYEEFLAYKVRVPVRGAILLDGSMENVLLVRGWKKGASWSFPRGKINKDEKDLDCAIREVDEETGFDVRSAGLVPENDSDVKYIDITMREQHMRLFVFRNVPEDTHFEPKTRKEIGKIQWYPIRDLPGFKKHKAGYEGEAAHANRFYMVAPFLGPLKKWINQQRKQDTEMTQTKIPSGAGMQPATEDEDDGEIGHTQAPPDVADYRSAELRRLLSIGAPAASTASVQHMQPVGQANNLLAMLQGGLKNSAPAPYTPFEQINPFPSQPDAPQPDHARVPIIQQAQSHPPPQFPWSPPRPQVRTQHPSNPLPIPTIFGTDPQVHANQPSAFGNVPPHLQAQVQHFHQMQKLQQLQAEPNRPSFPGAGPNGLQFNGVQKVPLQSQQPPYLAPQSAQVPPSQPPRPAPMVQGPQGVIANGPSAPNASQLPAPRLNAQSIKLLDAFKSADRSVVPSSTTRQPQKPVQNHQAALLDLFRKPVASSAAPVRAQPSAIPAVESIAEVSAPVPERPRIAQERRPTLNEITRTLPLKPKVKSPSQVAATPLQPIASSVRTRSSHSGRLFDPSGPTKPVSALPEPSQASPQQPTKILQPPPERQVQRSPMPKGVSPSGNQGGAGSQNAAPPSSFTILARPEPARGPKAPSVAAPSSPLRNHTPQPAAFQPQVLKRPNASINEDSFAAKETPGVSEPAQQKDSLLALFGNAAASSTAPKSAPSNPPTPQPASKPSQADTLLNLFNAPKQPPSAPAVPTPPSAPRIEPERHASSHHQHSKAPAPAPAPAAAAAAAAAAPPPARAPREHHHQQQNLLLNILSNNRQPSSNGTSPTVLSPGTPISPFMLGAPVTQPLGGKGRSYGGISSVSVGSGISPSAGSSAGGGAGIGVAVSGGGATPTEAKEFLMGYLNGVVKSEGARTR